MTRIAPLRKSADISATVESMTEKPTASFLLFTSSPYFRVWTIDECKYRLCGMTVAPRIPTAM